MGNYVFELDLVALIYGSSDFFFRIWGHSKIGIWILWEFMFCWIFGIWIEFNPRSVGFLFVCDLGIFYRY